VFRVKGDFFGPNALTLSRLTVAYGGPDVYKYIAGAASSVDVRRTPSPPSSSWPPLLVTFFVMSLVCSCALCEQWSAL
jgi:hypothetical protein